MRRIWRQSWSVLLLCIFIVAGVAPTIGAQTEQNSDEQSVIVGRIAHVEGKLLRYVPDEQDWVAVVKDAPFGFYDALYSEGGARAEFLMPNGTWLRIGGDTQIQLIALDAGVTEIDVAAGTARFKNQNNDGVIKATTPFGYVTAPANSSFDLYVGSESVEVVALEGQVAFVHSSTNSRYEVAAGSYALLADSQRVSSTDRYVEADWDKWNRQRDSVWTERSRAQVAGDSVEYLPPQLQNDAYVLDDYGRWENVYYEGEYRYFWRPVRVAAGWAPFTVGRWTVWYGDNCWIPAEPFGFVTHHYGSWVLVGGLWYWAPPVVRVGVRVGPPRPLLAIPFAWYPGRVAWIYSGVRIGWIPLAPFEPFYARRPWGPRVVVVDHVGGVAINLRDFRYLDHAIIVNQNNFYRVNSYRNVRIRDVNNVAIINDFRPAPVINDAVLHNFNKLPQRYDFGNVRVDFKPHRTTLDRIQHNQAVAQRNAHITAQSIHGDVARMQPGTPVPGAPIAPPKVQARLVPAGQVDKPVNQMNFQEKPLKGKPQTPGAQVQPVQPQTAPGAKVQPMQKQGPGAQVQPIQPQAPGAPPAGMEQQMKRPSGPQQQPGQGGQAQPPRQMKQAPVQGQGQPMPPAQGQQPQQVQKKQGQQPKAKPKTVQTGQPTPGGGAGYQGQQAKPQGRKEPQQMKPAKAAQPAMEGQQAPSATGRGQISAPQQQGKGQPAGQKKTKSPAELEAEQQGQQGKYGPQAQPQRQSVPPGRQQMQ